VKKVQVVCPECGVAKFIPIPTSVICRPDGLITVKVPNSLVCEHSFQIYLDQNMAIRGYQKSDFEINITADSSEGDETEKKAAPMNPIELLKGVGAENAPVLIESFLTISPTIIIAVPSNRVESASSGILAAIPDLKERVYFISREDYNKTWRNRVFSSEFIGAYVFDWEIKSVLKAPDKKLKPKFGQVVWDEIMKSRGEETQKIIFSNWSKKIIMYADVSADLIVKNARIKRKEIVGFLSEHKQFDEKKVPFEIIIKRLIHTKGGKFEEYL
jgi:hypothetical protein